MFKIDCFQCKNCVTLGDKWICESSFKDIDDITDEDGILKEDCQSFEYEE